MEIENIQAVTRSPLNNQGIGVFFSGSSLKNTPKTIFEIATNKGTILDGSILSLEVRLLQKRSQQRTNYGEEKGIFPDHKPGFSAPHLLDFRECSVPHLEIIDDVVLGNRDKFWTRV